MLFKLLYIAWQNLTVIVSGAIVVIIFYFKTGVEENTLNFVIARCKKWNVGDVHAYKLCSSQLDVTPSSSSFVVHFAIVVCKVI